MVKQTTPTGIRMSARMKVAFERFGDLLRHIAAEKGHKRPRTRDIATGAFEIAHDLLSGKVHKEWKKKAQADFEAAGEAWMKMREAQLRDELNREYLQKSLGLISEAFSEVLGPGVVAAKINADGVVEIRYIGQDETGDLAHTAAWMKAARAAGEGDNDRLQ